jgi:Skp family chaperone for outer membrane proteins
MSEIDAVEKLVEEAKAPGVFNIVSVLQERAYPKDDVHVYTDEQTAYEASQVKEKINELSKNADEAVKPEIEKLEKKRDALVKKLDESKYVFVISGISEGAREAAQKTAEEKFPIEYDEDKNPFTGEVTKREKENLERDRFFTNLLWTRHISKIIAPDGAEQEGLTYVEVEELRKVLPIAGIGAISNAIEKIRIATAMFMISVDEDFLAKP